jgi:hypothetical protein
MDGVMGVFSDDPMQATMKQFVKFHPLHASPSSSTLPLQLAHPSVIFLRRKKKPHTALTHLPHHFH